MRRALIWALLAAGTILGGVLFLDSLVYALDADTGRCRTLLISIVEKRFNISSPEAVRGEECWAGILLVASCFGAFVWSVMRRSSTGKSQS